MEMENAKTNKSWLTALIIGISIVASCLCLSLGLSHFRSESVHTISATGSANVDFESDLIIWRGSFSAADYTSKAAYDKIKKDSAVVKNYLIANGITEDEIIFELEKEGFAPSHCDLVVRVKNPKMNYLYGDREEIAKIDSDKNRVVFKKEVFGQAGMALLGLERLDNLEDLEFALFYNVKYDILAEEMSFNWDKTESQEVATIENIEFSEFVNDINDNLTSNHGNVNYEGRITEINDKYLKFYSERDKKELIISDPKQFEYINRKNKSTY